MSVLLWLARQTDAVAVRARLVQVTARGDGLAEPPTNILRTHRVSVPSHATRRNDRQQHKKKKKKKKKKEDDYTMSYTTASE